MSSWQPMDLPSETFIVETPDICAVCHEPAEKQYAVEHVKGRVIMVKLCDKHKPAGQEDKPRKAKGNPDQMSLF